MSQDAAVIARLVHALAGECRVCHCHGDNCKLPDGELCCWADPLRTLCNNPACLTAVGKVRRREKFRKQRAGRKSKGRAA